MDIIKRQGLVVWLYTLKQANSLKRLGYVHYTSEKMKYAIMYVDANISERVIEQLQSLHYVRDVEMSPIDSVDMTFKNALTQTGNHNENIDEASEDFFEEIAKQIKEAPALD